jgi:hypothetical protein
LLRRIYYLAVSIAGVKADGFDSKEAAVFTSLISSLYLELGIRSKNMI